MSLAEEIRKFKILGRQQAKYQRGDPGWSDQQVLFRCAQTRRVNASVRRGQVLHLDRQAASWRKQHCGWNCQALIPQQNRLTSTLF